MRVYVLRWGFRGSLLNEAFMVLFVVDLLSCGALVVLFHGLFLPWISHLGQIRI